MGTYDQFHDPGFGRLQHLLARHPSAGEFLKTASIEEQAPNLPPSAYAWAEKRLFPIHSPEHAALSGLYVKEAAEVPEFVRLKIAEACFAFDVPETIFHAALTKTAAPVADECIFPNGTYPVRTPDEVKTAETRLLEQTSRMTLQERNSAFNRLYKAASFHGVNLNPTSLQYAGKTACDANDLAEHVFARASATKDKELSEKFAKLGAAIRADKKALKDPHARTKLAQTIEVLDKQAGFDTRYGRDFNDPYLTVHNTTKLAGAGVEMGGRTFSHADLSRVPPTFYSDALGPDILPAIAPGGQVDPKLAMQVLETLPADIKRSFGRSLTAAGI